MNMEDAIDYCITLEAEPEPVTAEGRQDITIRKRGPSAGRLPFHISAQAPISASFCFRVRCLTAHSRAMACSLVSQRSQ